MPFETAPRFGVASVMLTGLIVGWMIVAAVRGPGLFRRLRAALAHGDRPTGVLVRYYRRSMIAMWSAVAVTVVVVAISPGVTAGDIGLRRPTGPTAVHAIGLTVAFLIALVLGRVRMARRRARGASVPGERTAAAVAPMLPRTPHERRWAVGLSISAGVGEEVVFRGLLIAAGMGILGLSADMSAVIAMVLFALGHLYQGPLAMIGPALGGVLLTGLYLLSGSLLLPVLAHVAFDLVALLAPVHSPAAPQPESGRAIATEPAAIGSTAAVSLPAQLTPPRSAVPPSVEPENVGGVA